jgi:hypothetical protein
VLRKVTFSSITSYHVLLASMANFHWRSFFINTVLIGMVFTTAAEYAFEHGILSRLIEDRTDRPKLVFVLNKILALFIAMLGAWIAHVRSACCFVCYTN